MTWPTEAVCLNSRGSKATCLVHPVQPHPSYTCMCSLTRAISLIRNYMHTLCTEFNMKTMKSSRRRQSPSKINLLSQQIYQKRKNIRSHLQQDKDIYVICDLMTCPSNSWTPRSVWMQKRSSELTPSVLGSGWPLMPRVRNGECVDRRLSHSLCRGSGTASMKFLFSSLMLAWCRSRSSWGLSNSYVSEVKVERRGTRCCGRR